MDGSSINFDLFVEFWTFGHTIAVIDIPKQLFGITNNSDNEAKSMRQKMMRFKMKTKNTCNFQWYTMKSLLIPFNLETKQLRNQPKTVVSLCRRTGHANNILFKRKKSKRIRKSKRKRRNILFWRFYAFFSFKLTTRQTCVENTFMCVTQKHQHKMII